LQIDEVDDSCVLPVGLEAEGLTLGSAFRLKSDLADVTPFVSTHPDARRRLSGMTNYEVGHWQASAIAVNGPGVPGAYPNQFNERS
jgi:hypothetical protein